jgi:hypothetical protein
MTLGQTSTALPRLRATVDRRELLLALPPAVLFLVWLGLLLASFGAIVEVIYANADISSAGVIAELFPKAPSAASTVLGYHPWYSTLWFDLATRWLPFHRQVWEVVPWLASLACIGAVAWATAKVAGRWAGWLVAFVLVCAGARLLTIQFGSDIHGATAMSVCLLDGFLVLLVLQRGRIGRPFLHVLVCVLLAAVTAANLASDVLLVPAGLVPFLAAGLAQLRWSPGLVGRRIAATTVAVTAGAAVGAGIAIAVMHQLHVYTGAHTVAFAQWDDLIGNGVNFVQSLADLFNGDFGGATVAAHSTLELACAAVVVTALVVALRLGWSQVERLRASERPITAAREAHVGFWFVAIVLTTIAFVLSNMAAISLGRYIVAAGYGAVVLAAVSVAGRGYAARAVAVTGACIIVAGSIAALAGRDIVSNPGQYPRNADARLISTFAQGEGLKVGYAAYWVAAPLTWESKLGIDVYPVVSCPASSGLCTYPWHEISSWYTPRPGTGSFLVVDRHYGPVDYTLGTPKDVATFGNYTVYAYDYDIASKLGNPKTYGVDGS